MDASQERILIVEDDPDVSDLIARQALRPLGYCVLVLHDAPMAIQEAVKFSPDILILGLDLPRLSGKDLLVALSSQGLDIPVIVIAEEGMEGDVIQAFRLGASDYLRRPIREAEVVSAVERALTQVRSKREREKLARKVDRTNRELQNRVRELTTILGIGKAVTSITDRHALFNKITEGAVFVAQADKGWLLLREGNSKRYKLSAQKNLPVSVAKKIDSTWDDGISSLVALSGEPLSIHGPPLRRFKVSRYGKSVLVVPVKIKNENVGLLAVARNESKPFNPSNRALLEALADYASISLVNVKLFQAVEERARSLMMVAEAGRESEKIKSEILHTLSGALESVLGTISHYVDAFTKDQANPLSDDQLGYIRLVREQLQRAETIKSGISMLLKVQATKKMEKVNLADLAQSAISRFEQPARRKSVELDLKIPTDPVTALVDADQINQVFDALLSNAIRGSADGCIVTIIRHDVDGSPQVAVKCSDLSITKKELDGIFDPFHGDGALKPEDLDNLGIELTLGREIVKAHGGKMWVESQPGQGTAFFIKLNPIE